MPEGAEVKRCAQVLGETVAGKNLVSIAPTSGKMLRLGVKGLDKLCLDGPAQITRVFTKGKMIFITILGDKEQYLISTLGMSGWWYPDKLDEDWIVYNAGKPVQASSVINSALKYTRLQIVTQDTTAAYCDPRNFGNMYLTDGDGMLKAADSLGPDLLTAIAADTYIRFRAKRYKKKPIGEVLLDQGLICGLGNIYRAEALYFAGVSPHRTVESLTDRDLARILDCAQYVLFNAFTNHGTMKYKLTDLVRLMLPEYHEALVKMLPGANDESFIKGHMVYYRRHATNETIGGRTMWWQPEMQA